MTRIVHPAPKAVYIHIPFCTNKCHYCDFNSYVLKGQPVMDYLEALDREMALTTQMIPADGIETIFVGGGTPTVLLPDQMEVFLQMVRKHFGRVYPDLEFTMEANPGTTDPDKLAVMKAGGVNRISFGVQTFNPDLLKTIGRIHNVDDVYRSIEYAKEAGFRNISIDLMFGLPKQSLKDMEQSLDAALALDLQHYSIYSLKVEENTLFHTLYENNQLPLPHEDEELAMFQLIIDKLKGSGYKHYEISNFALPGRESKHNSTYWRNLPYYGLGAGAHGYSNYSRHMNTKGIQEYISHSTTTKLPRSEENVVSNDEAMEDFMMVGLRLLQGVNHVDFQTQFGVSLEKVFNPVLQSLLHKGLLVSEEKGYRLSDQGLLFGNDVFAAFVGYFETKHLV